MNVVRELGIGVHHDSDTVWFVKAYLAVFSPILLLAGWRMLKNACWGRKGAQITGGRG